MRLACAAGSDRDIARQPVCVIRDSTTEGALRSDHDDFVKLARDLWGCKAQRTSASILRPDGPPWNGSNFGNLGWAEPSLVHIFAVLTFESAKLLQHCTTQRKQSTMQEPKVERTDPPPGDAAQDALDLVSGAELVLVADG